MNLSDFDTMKSLGTLLNDFKGDVIDQSRLSSTDTPVLTETSAKVGLDHYISLVGKLEQMTEIVNEEYEIVKAQIRAFKLG